MKVLCPKPSSVGPSPQKPPYSPYPNWEPSLLPLCSLSAFVLLQHFPSFITRVCIFFTLPQYLALCETRSHCAVSGCQTEGHRVRRVAHHSKMKMDSQGSKERKRINSGFFFQMAGYDLLGATEISTWESETLAC